MFVKFAVTVPMELDFDPTVFVGVDLFAWGAGDDGGLRAFDQRSFVEVYFGTVGGGHRDQFKFVAVFGAFGGGTGFEHLGLGAGVFYLGDKVFDIEGVEFVPTEGKTKARGAAVDVTFCRCGVARAVGGVQTGLTQVVTARGVAKVGWVVVYF